MLLKPLLQGEVARSAGGVLGENNATPSPARNAQSRHCEERSDEAIFCPHPHRHCEERSDEAIYNQPTHVYNRLPRSARNDERVHVITGKPLRHFVPPPLAGEAQEERDFSLKDFIKKGMHAVP